MYSKLETPLTADRFGLVLTLPLSANCGSAVSAVVRKSQNWGPVHTFVDDAFAARTAIPHDVALGDTFHCTLVIQRENTPRGQEEHGEGEEEDVARDVMAAMETWHEWGVEIRLGPNTRTSGKSSGQASDAERRGDWDKRPGAEVEAALSAGHSCEMGKEARAEERGCAGVPGCSGEGPLEEPAGNVQQAKTGGWPPGSAAACSRRKQGGATGMMWQLSPPPLRPQWSTATEAERQKNRWCKQGVNG
ncbi:hypothetical protein EDB83DRAFT_2327411 [Lactarius deliciosus]|nr:hypothetical protein EDB83DRAFT_2327411 [Lactarius deliciosus]